MRRTNQPARRHVVARPRLTDILDQSDARVILLVAPAGYGKTTLAREWLSDSEGLSTWYSCSAASADVAALAKGLTAAITEDAASVDHVRHWLRHTPNPEEELETLVSMLLHPHTVAPKPDRVVIDDYQQLVGEEEAEELIERVAFESEGQWLIATRVRPRWATERRLLYGEIHEIGATDLALTDDEAMAVVRLGGGSVDRGAGLLALARGWPAVIGLAARTVTPEIPDNVVPERLHDFFAEELLDSVTTDVRDDLQTLALIPPTSSDVAASLVKATNTFSEAQRIGFITLTHDDLYEMHPLLRTFLERKARRDAGYRERLHRVVESLADHARWDDALDVIDQSGEMSLLSSVLARSLDDLLGDGRVGTIERWLERARTQGLDTPGLDLADAEVALRRGDYLRAEALAARVSTIGPPELAVRALICAGRSAHFADRYEEALEYFGQARRRSTCTRDERDAVWGEMLAAHQVNGSAVEQLLVRFGELSDQSPETSLRLYIGKYQLAVAIGGVEELVETGRSLLPIAERARDPYVRSSFFDSLCRVFVLTGRYPDARAITDLELSDAKRFGLRFVLPLALCGRAFAELGMRRFAQAWAHADEADDLAREMGDVHSIFQVAVLRARICMARGDFTEASEWLQDVDHRRPGDQMWAELHVFRVLASACAGDDDVLIGEIVNAASANVESRVAAAAAAAIIALDRGDSTATAMDNLAEEVAATGCYDVLVTAYRSRAALLPELVARSDKLPRLLTTIANARDQALAQRLGIAVRALGRRRDLTGRETQVLALLAEGKSNREIADLLVISEATAKLHVRHILDKLGVRSRTEAALQASMKLDL
jgi:LuxR family transcriptional regulator, maltose regulon positive regulatory protein